MEDLGKSIPAAESMSEAEQGSKRIQNNEFCLNCHTKLRDVYCHHCGQKDLPRRQSMRELIENFIGSFYSFESKFFRTVRFLFLKPGFLPVEYTNGKRESYYHPARAYVFISFVFFLLFFSLPDKQGQPETENEQVLDEDFINLKEDSQMGEIDSALVNVLPRDSVIVLPYNGKRPKVKRKSGTVSLTESEYKSLAEYDSIQSTLPEPKRDGWFMRLLNRRSIELNKRYTGEEGMKRFGDDFGQAFLNNFSKVLFYLLPLFAFLLWLLYIRSDFYYSEHLVFAIYYYNFFYLASTLYLLFDLIPLVGNFLNFFLVLWMIIYLPIGMKRMYRQSMRKTIFKFGLFSFVFMIFLGLGLVGSMVFILMNL